MSNLGEAMGGMLAEAQLANVAVYALSPRGLTAEDNRLEQDFRRSVADNTGGMLLSAPRGALADLMPILPTTIREFAADDEVGGFVHVVQGGKSVPVQVNLEVRIADATNRVVHRASDTLERSAFDHARTAPYRFNVPVEHLSPGSFLLTIEARAGEHISQRQIRFTRK